jgi:hypothetical protein
MYISTITLLFIATTITGLPYKYAGGNLGYYHIDFYSNPTCDTSKTEEWVWAARADHSEPTCYKFRPEELTNGRKILSARLDKVSTVQLGVKGVFSVKVFANEECSVAVQGDGKPGYQEFKSPGECITFEEGMWSYFVSDT